jgi:hypothetical protein
MEEEPRNKEPEEPEEQEEQEEAGWGDDLPNAEEPTSAMDSDEAITGPKAKPPLDEHRGWGVTSPKSPPVGQAGGGISQFEGKLPPAPTTRVWDRPRRLGYTEMLRTSGGIVAPVLVGFALATIVLLVTSRVTPRLGEWAVAGFTAAVGCLLFSMQVAPLALGHSATPDERLSWYPEATRSREALDHARLEQAVDYQHVVRYWRLAGISYDLGLLSFLIGLLLLLVPTAWSSGATLAFAIGLLALVIELRWTSGTWFSRLRWTRVVKPLDETLKPVTLGDLDPMSQSAALTDVQSQSQANSEQATPSA